ncbi:MAG: hypothetical protein J7647_32165 [Cyanobacteria bacterium SBLK]|nr:hypothetical protein [Cyanobacteria bacterium SBLK]
MTKLIPLDRYPEDSESPPPGSVCDLGDGLLYCCPGCGEKSYLNTSDPQLPPYWARSGDLQNLTLSPSIYHKHGCGWHGWLRNGEFVGCD